MKQATLFLLETVFSFFTLLFLLRFYMQVLRVSFWGPLGQFVMTMTNWAARPLRRVIPAWGGFDLATLLAAFLLQLIFGILALTLIQPALWGLPEADLAWFLARDAAIGVARQSLHLLIGTTLLQAILSWVSPRSPLALPLDQLTRPFLNPIRRVLPAISGIDLSPVIVLVLAQAVLYLL